MSRAGRGQAVHDVLTTPQRISGSARSIAVPADLVGHSPSCRPGLGSRVSRRAVAATHRPGTSTTTPRRENTGAPQPARPQAFLDRGSVGLCREHRAQPGRNDLTSSLSRSQDRLSPLTLLLVQGPL
jgi:hypothetical protein